HVERIVLHVGVLDHGDLAVDVRDRRADRGALAAMWLAKEHDLAMLAAPGLDCLGRAVRRSVVDRHDLRVERKRSDPVEYVPDRRHLVVGCDQERDAHERIMYRSRSRVGPGSAQGHSGWTAGPRFAILVP